MPFAVRFAARDDAPAIARVHVESWRHAYANLLPADFLARLSEERRAEQWRVRVVQDLVLVAEDDTGLLGFTSGGPPQAPVADYGGELYTLYLRPDAQGRGAGRALVGALAAEMARRGYEDLVLWVLRDNPARGFYERLGGAPVAEQDITIGGVTLREVAYGWRPLRTLASGPS